MGEDVEINEAANNKETTLQSGPPMLNVPYNVWVLICNNLDLQSKMNLAFTCKYAYSTVLTCDNWAVMNLTQFGLCKHLTPECSVVSKCEDFCDRMWMVEKLYEWMRGKIWLFINWWIDQQFKLRKLVFAFNFGTAEDEFAEMIISFVYRVEYCKQVEIFADWKFTMNKTLELYQSHQESSDECNRLRVEYFWRFLQILHQRDAPVTHLTTVFDWSECSIQYISNLNFLTHLALTKLFAMESVSEERVISLLDSLPNLISLNLEVNIDMPVVSNNIIQQPLPSQDTCLKHYKLQYLDLTRCRNSLMCYLHMPQLRALRISRSTTKSFHTWDQVWVKCFQDALPSLPKLTRISVQSRSRVQDFYASEDNSWQHSLNYICQCEIHTKCS